ncbi:sentrin-specific protease 6-like isoform X2 [Panonychus citri]|uniref:sentrin-specific protease 6-like isoform X2 n=1 Tax=Panonychus citri TaxID=50023 RepID=UPI002306E474|nr:sentrin-specific protease 6-like isoform X2 [Panonychus citri]XP_053201767.1 sentrin-specific protease 6-like isoform X2 [Panonychus citri]XP_053203477.1 sentrin-specific protease 6-like isoform X2 [Panonychus citri]
MSHMEVNQTLSVYNNIVYFGVHKFCCDEIRLISAGIKFSQVCQVQERSRFNITIPPIDIKKAYFDSKTGENLSTLITETNPDSGTKISSALKLKPNQHDTNTQGSIRVLVQFNGQGEEIYKILEGYFSVFSQVDWKLERALSRSVLKYLDFLINYSQQPTPDLEISASKENDEKTTQSILCKSKKTYSSLPQSTNTTTSSMFSSALRSSSPPSKQSPILVKNKTNVLRPKSDESPSIIDIEIDSDDEDDTENQRSLNGSISNNDDHLFSYPPDEIDRISIHQSDLACLEQGQYLNDTILGFYLKYIEKDLTAPDIAERSYIFSTFFYYKLTHRTRVSETQTQDNQSLSDKYYNRVKNWTKNINIFEKDFIIIPINKSCHWFLAIICYPRKVPFMDEILPIEIEKNPKRPCILFMDSLQSAHSKCGLAAPIRHFLTKEWESKKTTKKNFSKSVMPDIYLKVPKQINSFDCGLYVLQYIENFLRNPDYLLERICKDPAINLEDWFSLSLVSSKRRTIKRLIKQQREAGENKKNDSILF